MRLSFKAFIANEEMNPSKDKEIQTSLGLGKEEDSESEDYFAAIGDELGIEWPDLKKAISKEPWVSAHFALGKPNKEVLYKLAAWQIVPGSLTPSGALIQLKPQKGNRSYLKGNRLNKSEPDGQVYRLNRQELIQFLTTGWTPAVQNAQGAAMGGGMGAPPGGDMMGGQQPPMGGPAPGGM